MHELNQEQREAVETIDGPLLVLAGAGSGKTRVVTYRIAHLLNQGILPSKILGLTFTNKAAGEMKERVKQLTNSDVLISTFHSLGAKILRESIEALGYRRDFLIYDEEDVEKLLKICISEHSASTIFKIELKPLRKWISSTKNRSPDAPFASTRSLGGASHLFPALFSSYQKKLKEYNAVDFDDLLFLPVRLLQEHPSTLEHYQNRWSHLLIDEYQDTNGLQYALVNLLVAKHHNICVVGDPDQSIYSWRGADIKNILGFEGNYSRVKTVRLEENYRSHPNILNAANALIAQNDNRFPKQLWSRRPAGEKIKICCCLNEKMEADFVTRRMIAYHQKGVSWNEMVVFYRTNAQSRPFEDYLRMRRIPYLLVGGLSFYQRREIKDILALLRMICSNGDQLSFERTINLPKRGVGSSTIEKLRLGSEQENLSILEYSAALLMEKPLQNPLKLTAKQKEGLNSYIELINALRLHARTQPLDQLLMTTIDLSRYKEHLEEEKETYQERCENLDSLVAKAKEYGTEPSHESLPQFLEELSLNSTLDELNETEQRVNLMTIHHGKGLEFQITFLVGMEEGLFPHINSSREEEKDVEEERRLCYVGMTRAKEVLYLTHAKSRFLWGTTRTQHPSSFLNQIPKEYVERSKM